MNNKKDYKNGKIYQITSHCGDKIYIGSTTKNIYRNGWISIEAVTNYGKVEK